MKLVLVSLKRSIESPNCFTGFSFDVGSPPASTGGVRGGDPITIHKKFAVKFYGS